MGKRAVRCSGLGLALLLQCLTLPSHALACVVGDGTGTCTEAALTACLPGGGLVTFNCGGAATITVTSTQTISADTTIDGGSLITISGGNSVGVFSVNAGVYFTVQNLTIANGNSYPYGGGIFNGAGTLTVTNSIFSNNIAQNGTDIGYGGGIYSGGPLTVTNSTFSNNSTDRGGGGIYSADTATVTNSTFSDNSAQDGGGISNGGTLTVTNSTFSGNSAYNGGGIYGGGTVTVTNSTFFDNFANMGGHIYNDAGTLTVTNSTFLGNSPPGTYAGGGIDNYNGMVTLTNTIVASSTGGFNCSGTITDGGHNISDDGSCGFSGIGCTSTSGSSFCKNPLLDSAGLADNGGPTLTIAIEPNSPAINTGDESVCSTTTGTAPIDNLDQRGFVRPGAGATNCSIGAFEANSAATPSPLVVNGTCMEAGSQGLVPCTAGTVVTAYLCTDPSCAALIALEVTQTDANGQFVFVLDRGQVAGKRLVFDATIVEVGGALTTRGRAASDTTVDLQIIDFGPVGAVTNLSELIDLASEAAVQLVDDNGGAQHYSDQGIKDVIRAVRTADSGINFAGLTAAAAVTLATDTAGNDPMVQAALQMKLCTGDCNGDGAVTVDDILTMVNIALGIEEVATCLPGDANNDKRITVDEILTAVNNALNRCAGH